MEGIEVFTEPDEFTNFFPEFDECIFDDLEFTSECIPQNRLGDVARDFAKAKPMEIICLMSHGCCRKRLVKNMIANRICDSEEEALCSLVRYFVRPEGGHEHFMHYVLLSLKPPAQQPAWFLNEDHIPAELLSRYQEHLQYPEEELVSLEEVLAITEHVKKCSECKTEIYTIPILALNSF